MNEAEPSSQSRRHDFTEEAHPVAWGRKIDPSSGGNRHYDRKFLTIELPVSESYKRRIDDGARLGENPDGFESEGRYDQTGVQNGRSFDQILHEFRAELLKLTPEQSYLTKIEFVEQLIAERDMRPKYLDLEFGEPAWDMLIDLLRAAEQRQKISVSSLTQASRVPATTALRQLASLKSRNFIETVPDPFDKRRLYVRLTANARASLDEYLADLAFRRRIVLLPSALIGRAAE